MAQTIDLICPKCGSPNIFDDGYGYTGDIASGTYEFDLWWNCGDCKYTFNDPEEIECEPEELVEQYNLAYLKCIDESGV